MPGASPNARPRVPPQHGKQALADAARALSAALAARRLSAGLKQEEFAAIIDYSGTTIAHAETGRLWQSRRFWERADKALIAGGELLRLYDAYRDAAAPDRAATAEDSETKTSTTAGVPPALAVAVSGPVTCVTITLADGTITSVYPPRSPADAGMVTS